MAIELAERRTFELASGHVAAELSGPEDGRLIIGVPGLSANLRSWDVIFPALGKHRRLGFDPRGRGLSDKTGPGTYGWPAHARDVIEMADQLAVEQFDLVGWSMGSWIAMKVCELAPGRVRRLVMIDAVGVPEERAKTPVYAGLERLGTVYPSRQAFMELAQQIPMYRPWEPWRDLFDYELEDVEGGVRARTVKEASWEDENYRLSQDPYALWPSVTMPSLLLYASQQIPPDFGFICPMSDVERYQREVPRAQTRAIDANHYTIGLQDDTARAIANFLYE